MNNPLIKLYPFWKGCLIGFILGCTVAICLFLKIQNRSFVKSEKKSSIQNTNKLHELLFPEMSLIDIYKNPKVIEILRDPESITIYSRQSNSMGKINGPIEAGGFKFFSNGKNVLNDDKVKLSICFRSINAFEVGFGYPCTFNPNYLIRFQSKSGENFVDFSFVANCHIVEWYFNGEIVSESVYRFKMNSIGTSILDSVDVR
jgi:hypothetical protein